MANPIEITTTGYINFKSFGTRTVTDTTTVLSSDDGVVCNKATAMTVNLPAATGTGKEYIISSIGAGTVTVDGSGSETINGATTQLLFQYESITVKDYATGAWVIV